LVGKAASVLIAQIARTPVASATDHSQLLRASDWLLAATIAGLPLYLVRWRYGPLPTTLLETLILVTGVVYVVARWRDGWRRPIATPLDIPIVLLLLAGAISVLVPSDHRTALGLYRAFFLEPVVIFYVGADLLRRPESLRRVIVALAIGSTILTLLNIGAFLQAFAAHTVKVGSAPTALYGDANFVAMYLEPVAAIAAGVFIYSQGWWRWMAAVWLGISTLALLLTFSKIAYLAVAVLAAAAILMLRHWRWPALAGFLLVGLVVSQVPLVKERWLYASDSLAGRVEIWEAAVRTLLAHPIFGVGLGGFHYLYRDRQEQPYPHDLWLAMWVEIGLLGVLVFAFIFIGLLVRGLRAWPRTSGIHRAALWGAILSLVMWAVHGVFDTPYFKNDMSVEFWVVAAITVTAAWSVAPTRSGDADRLARTA
jgi:O-antigen ligase